MKFAHLIASAAVAAGVGPAFAGPMFSDNFDAANGGVPVLNWTGGPNWQVTAGSVDLVGPGLYDIYPGNGLHIDLDGTTMAGGTFQTAVSFTPGDYTVKFTLGGNRRIADPDTVTVSLGSWSETFTLGQFDPLTEYTRAITTTGGPLVFSNSGGDNQGLLLTQVSVADRVGATASLPEPLSVAVFGGLAAVGGLAARRRMRKA